MDNLGEYLEFIDNGFISHILNCIAGGDTPTEVAERFDVPLWIIDDIISNNIDIYKWRWEEKVAGVLRTMGFSNGDITVWFVKSNLTFGGLKPKEMFELGKGELVYSTVMCLAQGNIS